MPSCFAPGCSSGTYLTRFKENVTFHRFPKLMKEKWLIAIGRDPETFVNYRYLCSEHFCEHDFEKYSQRRYIRPNTIPTQNLYLEQGVALEASITSRHQKEDGRENISPNIFEPSTSFSRQPQSLVRKRSGSPISGQPKERKADTVPESPDTTSSSLDSISSLGNRRLISAFHSYSKPMSQSKSVPMPTKTIEDLEKQVEELKKQVNFYRHKVKVMRRIIIRLDNTECPEIM